MRHHISMIGCTAPSHIYPSLALIRELVDRGHRVTYAMGERLVDLITPTGAEPVAHASQLPGAEADWPEDAGAAMRIFLDENIAVLPKLIETYDEDRPELFLYDIGGLAAPVLGHRYGVPALQLSPTYVAWDGYEEDFAEFIDGLRASESGAAYFKVYGEWLAENGIDAEPFAWLSHPANVLSLIPRAMQPNADRVGEHVEFVGPCLDPGRLADRSWTAPDGAKVLLVSFGTAVTDQLDIYRACIEGFRDSGWHVVLSVGNKIDLADLGDVPANFEVHRSVPQLAVLEAASAFVTHAGMGGSTESLWFGVPTVAIPFATDGFGNAARLEELGAGVQLPSDQVTAAALRSSVDQVANDPAVAQRLAVLSREVRANGGVGKAADAVASHLR
ncbi:macrolide family glycosyltransferase [Amycolatopsis sp. cg5]|uniref:macrolide family glycosyltransferase n=1 Tax=Amycolatopsis sp. cg5 TaxID=3238802 RepID=UPI00352386F6